MGGLSQCVPESFSAPSLPGQPRAALSSKRFAPNPLALSRHPTFSRTPSQYGWKAQCNCVPHPTLLTTVAAGFRLGFARHPASPQLENLSETYPCPAAVLTPLGAKLPPTCEPQAHSGCGSSDQVSDLFSCHFAPRALHPNHAGLSATPEPSRSIPTVCTAHLLTSCKSLLRGRLLTEAHPDRSLGSLPTLCCFLEPRSPVAYLPLARYTCRLWTISPADVDTTGPRT